MIASKPAPERPGRRAAGVERTRGAIVAAGRECLIADGYHRLGLEAVADRAQVTRVTIYRQFGSRLGLLEAIAEDLSARSGIVHAMRQVAAASDAASAFRALVHELCRFWASDPGLLRRLVSLDAVDPDARDLIQRREDWTYRQVAATVERLAAEDRVLEPFDALTAAAVVSAVTSFQSCDEMARRTGIPLAELDTLLIAGLHAVIRLG
ncbi:MAG: TetR/AcrR family transcriptional regulator [Nocardiopsaceae bacterium]|nr:TetR/AcrR family transcriptional regulator [Nocardiopsaceae bacterium]